MGQVAEIVRGGGSAGVGLWAYLGEQPPQATAALAYRAALRALPFARHFDRLDDATARYTLAACRAALTAGVLARKATPALRKVGLEAAKGTSSARRVHQKLVIADAIAADAMVRVISAVEATATADAELKADLAGHALLADPDAAEDFELAADMLMTAPIEASESPDGDLLDQFDAGDAWAFWRGWHEDAMLGDPLPWTIQAEIALLPQDVWEAGPDIVAARIERILARVELVARIDKLTRRMADGPDAKDDFETGIEVGIEGEKAAAGFAGARLVQEPLKEIVAQTQSPKPQPFLIQRATTRLKMVLAASGKWLGRSAEGDIKDMVRTIGKSGGVSTATWIEGHADPIRAVIVAADDWQRRLPA